MLRERKDYVNLPLPLDRKDGGAPLSVQVSLIAFEPLRRIEFPVAASDALRIEVGELKPIVALLNDSSITDVWVEMDVLDLDGGTTLRSKPLRKNAPKLDFAFSQVTRRAGRVVPIAPWRSLWDERDPRAALTSLDEP